MMRVCRLRNPRVGTWSSSEPDSLAPLNFGLPARPTRSVATDVAAAAAPVIPAAAVAAAADPSFPVGWINLMAGSIKRGLEGNDNWPTWKNKILKNQSCSVKLSSPIQWFVCLFYKQQGIETFILTFLVIVWCGRLVEGWMEMFLYTWE